MDRSLGTILSDWFDIKYIVVRELYRGHSREREGGRGRGREQAFSQSKEENIF